MFDFQPGFPYEYIENFTKERVARRDLGNRASPVDRAHMKRPLDDMTSVSNKLVNINVNGLPLTSSYFFAQNFLELISIMAVHRGSVQSEHSFPVSRAA